MKQELAGSADHAAQYAHSVESFDIYTDLDDYLFDNSVDFGNPENDNPDLTNRSTAGNLWECLRCGNRVFSWDNASNDWHCNACFSYEYFDPTLPAKKQTAGGTWVFMPRGSSEPPQVPPSSAASRRRHRARRRRRVGGSNPGDPDDGDDGREWAESEVPTLDPPMDVTPAGSNVANNRGNHQNGGDPIAALTDALRQLTRDNDLGRGPSTSTDSWVSAMGPQRGVKFRGGAPPVPPSWSYNSSDLRAYEKFEKKVRIWALHAKHFMTDSEAALTLYTSLKGEAEQELEFVDINTIYHKDGVDTILNHLKQAFQQKTVYIKRQYLHDYETIGRWPGETLRTFINRYRRVESSLRAIGVDICLTYDDESRGSRLLDRSRLTLEQQRLVLVGTNQSLSFESVRAALMLQYPEHKPSPPVAGRDASTAPFQTKGNSGKGSSSSSSSSNSPSVANGKGKGKDKGYKRVYQTETIPEEAPEDDAGDEPEADQEAEDDGNIPEQDAQDNEDADVDDGDMDVAHLTEVLTVTARKLASVTQGRKFSGQPRKSIAEKKKTSICAACGQRGHWAGDAECDQSGSQDAKNNSSSTSAAPKGKERGHKGKDDGASKKVMTVHHSTGFDSTVEYLPHHAPSHPHFTMVCTAPYVCLSTVSGDTTGYMIMDTACQRCCCGTQWIALQADKLASWKLKVFEEASHEQFQFGAGEPVLSTLKVWMPSAIEKQCLIFGVNVVDTSIPFLGSLRLLKRLGGVIDLIQQVVYFSKLDVTTPLKRIGGHLAIDILNFPPQPNRLRVWSQISDAGFNDPEVASVFNLQQVNFDDDDTATLALPATRSQLMPSSSDCDHDALRPRGEKALEASMRKAADAVGNCSSALPTGSPPWVDPLRRLRELPQEPRENEGQEEETGQVQSASQAIGHRHLPEPAPGSVPAQGVQAPRQQARQFRDMRDLQGQMGVGRNRLEVAWMLLQIITASTVFLNNSGWVNPSANDASDGIPSGTSSFDWCHAQGAASTKQQDWQDQVQASFHDLFGSRTHEARRDPDSGSGDLRSGVQLQLAPGRRKRLTGDLKKSIKIGEAEVLVLNNLPNESSKTNAVDLLELYAGAGKATLMAKQYGLNALEPFDKNEGKDLDDPEQKRLVERAIERFKPLLLMLGFPCTFWCLLNENCNYSWRMHELEALRNEQRPLLQWTWYLIEIQVGLGNFFLFESTLRCRIWDEPCVIKLAQLPGVVEVLCDAGAFGAADRDGFPIIKTHKFLTNSPILASSLHRRLSAQERQVCKPLEGINVTRSQEYPDAMVRSILRALKDHARQVTPNRFDYHKVFSAQPLDDAEAWKKLLDDVQNTFAGSAVKSLILQPGQELYEKVSKLVPWELTRVQIVSTPITRRMPKDAAFTHRGAALLFADQSLSVEAEDLANVRFPKQRFTKAVNAAILFYGLADDDGSGPQHQPQLDEAEARLLVPGLRTDVTWPCPQEGADSTFGFSWLNQRTNIDSN